MERSRRVTLDPAPSSLDVGLDAVAPPPPEPVDLTPEPLPLYDSQEMKSHKPVQDADEFLDLEEVAPGPAKLARSG